MWNTKPWTSKPLLTAAGAVVTVTLLASVGLMGGPAATVTRLAEAVGAGPSGDSSSSQNCKVPCAGVGVQLPLPPGASDVQGSTNFTVIGPGYNGAEPTLGVAANGQEVYIQFGTSTVRTLNGGTNWNEIAPVYMNQVTFDPMLYYDRALDRVYANHLTVECSLLAWRDNPELATGSFTDIGWKFTPHACGLPGIDHQKLEGGPSTLGVANGGRVLYLAYSQAGGGAQVARSLDGGFTWVNSVAATALQRGTVLWPTGPVTADPAGAYVYLPSHTPSSGLQVYVSSNEGLTYSLKTVTTGYGTSGHAVDPEVAVDAAGNAYAVWYSNSDHQVYYSYSENHGTLWSTPKKISNSSVTLSTVFPAAVANSTGKFNVAYYGTPNSTAGPDGCAATGGSKCVWSVYHAQVTNANTSTPTINVTQVTPNSDVVQIGKICTEGLDCATGTRGLLDFIDIKVDGSGYSHIAYADGCDCNNATSGQTGGSAGRYARQTDGATI